MLTAEQVLDTYFLDGRCMLLEVAAMLDRLDAAGGPSGNATAGDPRLDKIHRALAILADRGGGPDRAAQLLTLFSDPVD